MGERRETLLRRIPSVEALLTDPAFQSWSAGLPRAVVVGAVRSATDAVRRSLADGTADLADESAIRSAILELARRAASERLGPHYRRVVNATGIILHTGLGRAVLPARAVRQVVEHLSGYSLLQVDTAGGKRSRREARLEWLLQQLTGCEAATVVNNNAAATMLVLNTVGAGKEIIVSRGQLVEIGGSYRLPDVFRTAGVRLVEVGTTNKTHLRDYEQAITPETAAILRVHPSNYKIFGFTSEVPRRELVELAHERGLTLIDDVGAGALVDFSRFGFRDQETLPESIRDGADITTSSADKLIGGPQGGIILGRRELIDRVRKNPLARILRVDKVTLAALEATLTLFLDEETALREVPTLAMLMRPLGQLDAQARRIAERIGRGAAAEVSVIDGFSQMGSGSLPTQDVPTRLVAVLPRAMSVDELAARLRASEPPVFARIQDGQLLVDPRTLIEGDEAPLVEALGAALRKES